MRITKKFTYIVVVSLPVIIFAFKFSILYRHETFGYDWGYFAQIYEAARISILKYHQFPWWNPWSIGGVPLYANPQFGLVSIPMILSLAFGTIVGLHLSVMVYLLIGFWGMYMLLNRLGSDTKYIRIPLSYIWTFSGFVIAHMAVGHLTFSVYLLAPWFFLTLLNIRKRRGWLWFGLMAAYIIFQAPHNITVEILAIAIVVATFQIIKGWWSDKRSFVQLFKPYLLAILILLPLVIIKLFFVFQYLHQYPRITSLDSTVSFGLLLSALSAREFQNIPKTYRAQYNWWEYADYVGLITLALFIYSFLEKIVKRSGLDKVAWAILIATAMSFLIALGPFSSISPYVIIHHLPVFNQMRVPSRWIGWVSFGLIIFLAKLPKQPLVYVLLFASALDVFIANFGILNYSEVAYTQPALYSNAIKPYAYYHFKQTGLSAIYADDSNVDQVYGYEPILGFGGDYDYARYTPMTNRCGLNQGCSFIQSHNATIVYWSPLKIIIDRRSPGPITLDMNPGSEWLVNGKRIFSNYRVLELKRNFVLTNPTKKIIITFSPSL